MPWSPLGPWMPWSPLGPWMPWSPFSPCGPWVPIAFQSSAVSFFLQPSFESLLRLSPLPLSALSWLSSSALSLLSSSACESTIMILPWLSTQAWMTWSTTASGWARTRGTARNRNSPPRTAAKKIRGIGMPAILEVDTIFTSIKDSQSETGYGPVHAVRPSSGVSPEFSVRLTKGARHSTTGRLNLANATPFPAGHRNIR